jgi:hypothetical protein
MARRVEARLTLRVPRDGERGLYEEAVDRLDRTAVVDRVEAFEVVGVRPGLNDLRVRATAAFVTADEAGTAVEALGDTVGIEAVERLDDGGEP